MGSWRGYQRKTKSGRSSLEIERSQGMAFVGAFEYSKFQRQSMEIKVLLGFI